MTIFDALKEDHKKIRHILEQLDNTSDAAVVRRQTLTDKLWDALIPHLRAEEKVLYDTLVEVEGTREGGMKSYEEHRSVEALLRDLSLLDPAGDRFYARFSVLKENLEHHLQEEEQRIFEEAKIVLAPEEVQVMAEVYKSLRDEVAESSMAEVMLETPRYSDLRP
jgi:hemerythrin-like domain-containing protein